MNVLTKRDLASRAKQWIEHYNSNGNSALGSLTEDTNLVAEGFLDSLGFIELLEFVEKETGCKIDLSDMDPEQFTTLKGLCAAAYGNNGTA